MFLSKFCPKIKLSQGESPTLLSNFAKNIIVLNQICAKNWNDAQEESPAFYQNLKKSERVVSPAFLILFLFLLRS